MRSCSLDWLRYDQKHRCSNASDKRELNCEDDQSARSRFVSRRLLGMPQSEAQAQLLRNLCQSWVRLANQADLYRDNVRNESRSENGKAALVGGLF
jgi:hypothetical protein